MWFSEMSNLVTFWMKQRKSSFDLPGSCIPEKVRAHSEHATAQSYSLVKADGGLGEVNTSSALAALRRGDLQNKSLCPMCNRTTSGTEWTGCQPAGQASMARFSPVPPITQSTWWHGWRLSLTPLVAFQFNLIFWDAGDQRQALAYAKQEWCP
jgi:hypothetical protein